MDIKNRTTFKTVTAVIFIAIFVAGCSSSTDSEPEEEVDQQETITEAGFNGRLTSQTTYIDENNVSSTLIESDTESDTYIFDAAALEEEGIVFEPGQVLLIHQTALGRITSVQESGGSVSVQTEFAALTDAFEELDMEWDESFQFTPDIIEKSVMEYRGKEIYPKKNDPDNCAGFQEGCFGWDATVGEYTIKGRIVGNGANAEVIVIMSKQVGGDNVAFRAESTIQEIKNSTNLQIEDGETKQFDFQNPNMGGQVKLSLAAAGGGVGPDLSFGPQTMIRFPFSIGPLPMVMAVKVRTVAKVEVQSNASATAEATFRYGGSAGVQYDGLNLIPNKDQQIENPQIEGGGGDLAAAIGLNVDVQWGFSAPELELQLFGNTLVPYLRPEFFLQGGLTWGPVCQEVKLRYNVSSGLDLRFLGQDISNLVETKVVEEKEWNYYAPEGCDEPSKFADPLMQSLVGFGNNGISPEFPYNATR
jgi:hypothetical protein